MFTRKGDDDALKKIALMLLTFLPLLLGGCTGGQEIESSLFVIAMAVDAAPEGNLTITVKALSGSQESAASGTSGAQSEAGSPKTWNKPKQATSS